MSQLPSCPGASLVAIGSSDPQRAARFAAEQVPDLTCAPARYDEILADDGVDAVYLSTVHTTHPSLAIAALEAGKHVLCEKPLAANHASVMAMAEVARRTGRVLLEAYMYRFHPQTRAVLELIADGAVGEVQHVDASFSFRAGERPAAVRPRHRRRRHPGRRRLPRLVRPGDPRRGQRSSGSLEPTAVTARGTLGPTGIDEWAVADLTFPGGATASVRTGVKVADPTTVTVHGSRGTLHLSDPWTLGTEQQIVITTVDGERVVEFSGDQPYGLEAAGLARAAAGDGLVAR